MDLKVKKSHLFMILFILVFIKPTIVDITAFLTPLNFLYDICRVVFMTIVPCWYAITKRHSRHTVLLVTIYAMMIASTIINKGDLRNIILSAGNVFAFVMFAEICIEEKGKIFLLTLKNILFIYVILNFATLVLFPGGWYISGQVNPEGWFLGNKNSFIMFTLPYLFSVYALASLRNAKLNKMDIVGVIITVVSTLLSRSSTSIVGVAVFFIIYYMKTLFKSAISAFLGLIISGVLFVLIVLMNMTHIFSFIIVQILQKDLTLTVRTYVWEAAIEWFTNSPIIGVGNQPVDIAKLHMFGYYHPHCTYLYYLVFAGLVGYALFAMYLFVISRKIDKLGKKEQMLSIPSVAAFWSVLIIWLADVYARPELLFTVLLLAASMDTLKQGGIQDKKRTQVKINS